MFLPRDAVHSTCSIPIKKIKINVTLITAVMVSTAFTTVPSNFFDILFMLKNFKSDTI